MKPLIINSNAFHTLIVHPTFQANEPQYNGSYSGTLGEFTVFDNVSLAKGSPIIDLFRKRNILQRRDASCKTNWKQIAKGSTRKITIDELYGAVEDCQQEFYQGCLKDFRNQDNKFRDFILQFFKQAVYDDISSNVYFGNVGRPADPDGNFSWNIFDGIFTKYAEYIIQDNELSPKSMEIVTSDTTNGISPVEAFKTLSDMYKQQTSVLRGQLPTDKAYYVDVAFAEAYVDYCISIGKEAGDISMMMNGVPVLKFKQIPIFVEPTWQPVLEALNGDKPAYAAILTIRGNFGFGTNKNYGGGPNLNQGLRVWYSEDDEVWRYKSHLALGTDIISPQNSVVALTEIL
ncbi:hypothetical protein [Empedobacter falsenii]|uniref:hypothetical protein n=1 Tax=Empedobacter falsenii TaxID=343874 RepID=UPI003A80B17B